MSELKEIGPYIYHKVQQESGLIQRSFWFRAKKNGQRSDITWMFGRMPKAHMGSGFTISLGNKGSETPVDIFAGLFKVYLFFSIDSDWFRNFCHSITRGGHVKNGWRIHHGQLWWEIWHKTGPYGQEIHKCDGWRRPKLWPWSAGRNKYRPWMCLRNGNIELNPLDAIWGTRKYKYQTVAREYRDIDFGGYDGDIHHVEMTLQKQTRQREHGPKWVRKREDKGYSVEWECKKGIPYRNDSWKGDCTYGSGFDSDGSDQFWVLDAKKKLVKLITHDRINYNYIPDR